jgi:long-chain acyl-CoA synthetase
VAEFLPAILMSLKNLAVKKPDSSGNIHLINNPASPAATATTHDIGEAKTRLELRTINDVFYAVVQKDVERAMLYRRGVDWAAISSRELYRYVRGTAHSLTEWGIAAGDRVAILSENRPEWAIADFAIMLLGAIGVPIYHTLTAEQAAYMINDAGARVLFVSSADHLKKMLDVRDRIPNVERIVVMDEVRGSKAIFMGRLMGSVPPGRDPEFDERARQVSPETVATMIYTSGTTGTPKGAMLTQGNLASNLFHSLDFYGFGPGNVSVSFLPLSHITARHADYAMFFRGVTLAYVPFIDELMAALPEVRPTVFVGVPRVYEKMYNQVQGKIGVGLKRKIYDWALGVGRAHKDEVLAGRRPRSLRWKLAWKLVFSKLYEALGGSVTVFISGGAPLSKDLIDWYGSVGIRIYEGYGLTETSPVIALNNPADYRAGSVGKPLKNLQVKIAPDGEILVKGPSIFKGYWSLPEQTASAFEDGWFKTGDIGKIDEDGFLYVTDRKKDLIKTSGGKFIAPQPIENKLKLNPFINEAALVGDRRKFPMVVIAPDFAVLEKWAKENGITTMSRQELVDNDKVRDLYKGVVSELNQNLAQFEKIKKILIVPDEFSIADGTLTPTMKLKRRVVEQRYRQQIEELYSSTSPMAEAMNIG